jgi:iron complex transport system permease protein
MESVVADPMPRVRPFPAPGPTRAFHVTVVVSLVALILLELAIGAVQIPLSATLRFLVSGHTGQESWDRILLIARLPRVLNAAACGAALGACGIVLQTMFRNALADPYVLGTVHGARLGVAVLLAATGATGVFYSTSTGVWAYVGIATAAAIASGLVTVILILASRIVERAALLILGLMIGFLAIGLIDIALRFADESQVLVFRFWDHGSFAGATWEQLAVVLPAVSIGSVLALSQVKSLNALVLGETYAASMGIAVGRARALSFTAAAILAGVVTAFSGPVAFLGLIVAQFCRALLKTTEHRTLIPAALGLGAVLAVGVDLLVHLPWKGEPPHLDATFALVGGPLVIWFVLRGGNRHVLDI